MSTTSARIEPISTSVLDLSFHNKSTDDATQQQPPSLSPQPQSLKELLTLIRRNQLTELRLGWTEHDCVLSSAFPGRAARLLVLALQQNRSIQRVSFGYRSLMPSHVGLVGRHAQTASATALTKRRKVAVCRILQALATFLSQQITHLQLVLNDSLPEHVLKQVLGSFSKLVVLELHSVQVEEAAMRTWTRSSKSNTPVTTTPVDSNVVSRVLIHCKFSHLKSLALVDCHMTDDTAILLADYLHIRGGLQRLSLRNNRKISARGWNIVTQAPVMDRLDASLCDLECAEIKAIARGLVKRPWPLRALLLNGNYRMDVPGLLAITSPVCCEKLMALDLSYCDIGDYKALKTIMNLRRMTPNAILQQLTMHGSLVSGSEVSSELTLLLKSNSSLRVVRLNDPSKPKMLGTRQLEGLLSSLRDNYEMEELRVDSSRSPDETHILEEMDFFMRLNRAGRRMLRISNYSQQPQREFQPQPLVLQRPPARRIDHDDEWFKTIERAGDDLDVVFWLVKQSAGRFGATSVVRDKRKRRQTSRKRLLLFIRGGRSERSMTLVDGH